MYVPLNKTIPHCTHLKGVRFVLVAMVVENRIPNEKAYVLRNRKECLESQFTQMPNQIFITICRVMPFVIPFHENVWKYYWKIRIQSEETWCKIWNICYMYKIANGFCGRTLEDLLIVRWT